MQEREPNINQSDENAKLAWSQMVERAGGEFGARGNLYLMGTIHGPKGVHADVRLYKLKEFQGGGYFVYINDIASSEAESNGYTEDIITAEIKTIVDFISAIKDRGIDIKRFNIQASSGDQEKLHDRVKAALPWIN